MFEVYVIKVDGRPVATGRLNAAKRRTETAYRNLCKRFGAKHNGEAAYEVVLITEDIHLATSRATKLIKEIQQADNGPTNHVKRRRACFIGPRSKAKPPKFQYFIEDGLWVLKDVSNAV